MRSTLRLALSLFVLTDLCAFGAWPELPPMPEPLAQVIEGTPSLFDPELVPFPFGLEDLPAELVAVDPMAELFRLLENPEPLVANPTTGLVVEPLPRSILGTAP